MGKKGLVLFTIFILFLGKNSWVHAYPMVITTENGQQFLWEASLNQTLSEVLGEIEDTLSDVAALETMKMELAFENNGYAKKMPWFGKVKVKHGKYLGYPREYVAQINDQEKAAIRYIVDYLSNPKHGPFALLDHKETLEKYGDSIDHLHPLNFLMAIFSDEEMKVKIISLRGRSLVWGDFIGGVKHSLATEAANENITYNQIDHFASVVGVQSHEIVPYIAERKWDQFIDYLISKVQRRGDFNRYNS